jgi:hypothetical protein
VVHPAGTADWLQVFGIAACALVGGLFVAARYTVRTPDRPSKQAREAGS